MNLRLLLLLLIALPALAGADLSVELKSIDAPLINRPALLILDLTNHGPDRATDIAIDWHAEVPPPMQTGEFRCLPAGNGLRCEVDALEAGQTLRLRADKVLHPYNEYFRATVTAATPDPNLENNVSFIHVRPLDPAGEVRAYVEAPKAFASDNTLTFRYTIVNQSFDYPAPLIARVSIPSAIELVSTNGDCRLNGTQARCSLDLAPKATFELEVTARLAEPAGRVDTTLELLWRGYSNEAIYTATGSGLYPRRFAVTSAADDGPGSLRAAISEANARCVVEVPCAISAEGGPFTIAPVTPLPSIAAPTISLDGAGAVSLDGSLLATGSGFDLRGHSAVISGFTIRNFPESGITGVPDDAFSSSWSIRENVISGNNRGIMIRGGSGGIAKNVIAGNVYSGVFVSDVRSLQVSDNRISGNGATGVFVGSNNQGIFSNIDVFRNGIIENGHFGIAYPSSVWVTVGSNRISENGLGAVDIDLDGPSPNAGGLATPRITGAFWDGTGTIVQGTAPVREIGSISKSYSVFLYSTSTAAAQGQRHVTTVDVDPSGHFSVWVEEDLRGQYVDGMTLEKVNFFGEYEQTRTSEFGEPVPVQ